MHKNLIIDKIPCKYEGGFNLSTFRIRLRSHFENGFSFYFILALILTLGIIIGALMIKAINNDTLMLLVNHSNPYLYGQLKGYLSNLDILKLSIFLNIVFAIFTYFIGLVNFGFLIPLIIFIRGLQFGLVVGYIVFNFGFKGFGVSLLGLYPQYLIFIPCLLSLGALSMMVSLKYRVNSGIKLMKMKRMNISDYTILVMINIGILIIGSLYEGLISPIFLDFIFF